MKIHFLVNESIYNTAFINFISNNCNYDNHLFIFRSTKQNEVYPGNIHQQIIYANNFYKLLFLIPKLIRCERIFFHSLPYGPSLFFWSVFRCFIKKSVWIFWGYDVYAFEQRKSHLINYLYETCRKLIIKKLFQIAGFIEGDYDIIKRIYHMSAPYYYIIYPLPLTYGFFEPQTNNTNQIKEKIKILIGNSADPSNNHINCLKLLEKFKHFEVEIICPLSYGGNINYIKQVINFGQNSFGKCFIPLTELLTIENYAKILRETDIAIMFHDRQQGLGNVLPLLYSGKKVYIKSNTTSFQYFIRKEIIVFDSFNISKESFEEFITFNQQIAFKNNSIIKSEFSTSNYKMMWDNLLQV